MNNLSENPSIERPKILRHAVQENCKSKAIPAIRNIIAVGSGKGGVGKSTTAVNLALALHSLGARTGLLDADIYGPSLPILLGNPQKPDILEQKKILPLLKYGLQCMSIGYLIDAESPMIWRGPMVSQALQQLLYETAWDDLDFLIIDLPPGTGDIQLTLAQKIPVAGAVIVTTPQDIALADAIKAIKMFQKLEISVLGVVENMSMHICSACGHTDSIFGDGGGVRMAESFDLCLLGQLPLQASIRQQTDLGTPPLVQEPDSKISDLYRKIAKNMMQQLSLKPRLDTSLKIVVE